MSDPLLANLEAAGNSSRDRVLVASLKSREREFTITYGLSILMSIVGMVMLAFCLPSLLETPFRVLSKHVAELQARQVEQTGKLEREKVGLPRLKAEIEVTSLNLTQARQARDKGLNDRNELLVSLRAIDPTQVSFDGGINPLVVFDKVPETGFELIEAALPKLTENYNQLQQLKKSRAQGESEGGPLSSKLRGIEESRQETIKAYCREIVEQPLQKYRAQAVQSRLAIELWRHQFVSEKSVQRDSGRDRMIVSRLDRDELGRDRIGAWRLTQDDTTALPADPDLMDTLAMSRLVAQAVSRLRRDRLGQIDPETNTYRLLPLPIQPLDGTPRRQSVPGDGSSIEESKFWSPTDALRVWKQIEDQLEALCPGAVKYLAPARLPKPPSPVSAPSSIWSTPPTSPGGPPGPPAPDLLPSPPPAAVDAPGGDESKPRPATPPPATDAPTPAPTVAVSPTAAGGESAAFPALPLPIAMSEIPYTHPSKEDEQEVVESFVASIRSQLDHYRAFVAANQDEIRSFIRANSLLYRYETSIEAASQDLQSCLAQALEAKLRTPDASVDSEMLTFLRVMCLKLYQDSRVTAESLRKIVSTSASLSKALLDAKQAEKGRIDRDLEVTLKTVADLEATKARLDEQLLESEKKTADLEAQRRAIEEDEKRERASLPTAQNSSGSQGAVAGAVAAAICQLVSGLFFVIALRAQRFLSQTMERVRRSASHREALSLLGTIRDPRERDRLRGVLICNLAGVGAPSTTSPAGEPHPPKALSGRARREAAPTPEPSGG